MIRVGLTGSRFSGKDAAAKAFRQIGVPVFDADAVLKFILNFDIEVNRSIVEGYGEYVFTGPGGTIDPKKMRTDADFDRLVDFAEPSLMSAFDRFCDQNRGSIYSIFHSSILVERNWHDDMDYAISVFAPPAEIFFRQAAAKKNPAAKKEMDPLAKNKACDFVIHSYGSVLGDVMGQIGKIDQKIVDKFLDQKEWLMAQP